MVEKDKGTRNQREEEQNGETEELVVQGLQLYWQYLEFKRCAVEEESGCEKLL